MIHRLTSLIALLLSTWSFNVYSNDCGPLIDKMNNIGELKKILYCLNNGNNAPRAQAVAFQQAAVKSKQTLVRYLFEVEHCNRDNTQVSCSVVITNKNKTVYSPDYREFGIYIADSHFFDEYGQEFNATQGTMGTITVEAQGPSNRKNFKDGYLEKYMPIGIPMRLKITFDSIDSDTTTVMALNIRFSHRDGKDLASKFVTLEGISIAD